MMKTPDKLFAELRLPPELIQTALDKAEAINPANASPLEAAAWVRMCWPAGYPLRITFLEGLQAVQQKVIFYAQQWREYANISFDFGNDPDAEIRITFREGFSQSYIGVSALYAPASAATMNLWLTPSDSEEEYSRIVLHEFGHALGLIHEHQSPAIGIKWDHQAVIQELTSPPYNCTKKEIEENYFERLAITQTQYTRFDPKSIMLYWIPARWTLDGFSTSWNTMLSATDKQFISKLYPW
jgi:Astacin (Peptidase family M12A)